MMPTLIGLALAMALLVGSAWAFPVHTLRAALRLQRTLAGLRTRRIRAGGFNWSYLDGGRGEPIVMVHGFSATKDNWVLFAARLRRHYRVIAPDLPGSGDTGADAHLGFGVGYQVHRLHAFIEALGLGPVHLVGNSMGGHIVGLYAAHYPGRVKSLALFDNAGVEPPRKSVFIQRLEATEGEDNLLILKDKDDYPRLERFLFVRAPFTPALIRRGLIRYMLSLRDYHTRMFRHLIDGYEPLEPLLPRIACPTLILWGESDQVLDVSSIEVMAPLIRDCTVVVMPKCGHIPMLERPAETAAHYTTFLTRKNK